LNESDKAAFLDGYRAAMSESSSRTEILCKVLREGVQPSTDQQAFMKEVAAATLVCGQINEFAGFEKITTSDLDAFYSDPVNQPIVLEWTMRYLRDKTSGRKTEGQLLDALNSEQKDIHDCSKYPNLCKLGAKVSQTSQH
jgi:hypothetical protein